jgi:hypothetical protein
LGKRGRREYGDGREKAGHDRWHPPMANPVALVVRIILLHFILFSVHRFRRPASLTASECP